MTFWKQLQSLVQDTFHPATEEENTIELPFACAILLVEIARSDFEISDAEIQTITQVLQTLYQQSEQQAKQLVTTAIEHIESLTCLHDFTKAIDEAFSKTEKETLITALWQVAYADGTLDAHETHWIKRLGDLLHVERSFIFKCKEEALKLSS